MREKLSEKLLYAIATFIDFYSKGFSWEGALASMDDPRYMRYRRLLVKYLEGKKHRQKLYSALQTLKRSRYIQKKIIGNSEGYFLTPKGKLKLRRSKFYNLYQDKFPKGQYLLVFFDIPERRRGKRDSFRKMLRRLNFERVQKSVWICSFNVEKEVREIIQELDIKDDVSILKVNEVKGGRIGG
jgi:CRISPR-associated endonuclease Cas2